MTTVLYMTAKDGMTTCDGYGGVHAGVTESGVKSTYKRPLCGMPSPRHRKKLKTTVITRPFEMAGHFSAKIVALSTI